MIITIYTPDLVRKASFTTCVSLLWQPKYNEAGKFQLELTGESGVLGAIKPYDYVTVDFDDNVMLVLSIQFKDGKVVINGKTAVHLLTRRASTAVIRNKNAEEAMRGLVADMTPWNHVGVGTSAGLTDKFTAQTSDGSVYEYCVKIAQFCDMGFRFRKVGDQLLFECYKPPLNTNVRYAAILGNMGDEQYAESEVDFANVAIVAGAGSGDARVTVTVGAVDAVGADRREVYFDARHIQPEENESSADYESRLVAFGEGKLAELAKVQTTSFVIADDDIKLGDLVTVKSVYADAPYQTRITGISYKSQNNTMKKTISVGTLIPTQKRG